MTLPIRNEAMLYQDRLGTPNEIQNENPRVVFFAPRHQRWLIHPRRHRWRPVITYIPYHTIYIPHIYKYIHTTYIYIYHIYIYIPYTHTRRLFWVSLSSACETIFMVPKRTIICQDRLGTNATKSGRRGREKEGRCSVVAAHATKPNPPTFGESPGAEFPPPPPPPFECKSLRPIPRKKDIGKNTCQISLDHLSLDCVGEMNSSTHRAAAFASTPLASTAP